MSRNQGTFNFAANFEVLAKAPLDARMLVETYADLTLASTWEDTDSNIWLFDGAIVSVSADPSTEYNGIYYLKDAANYNNIDNWEKAGADPSIGVVNIGDGSAGVFAGYDSSGNITLRDFVGVGAATVTQNGDVIEIGIDASFGGEINTASNIGSGDASVFYGKTESDLTFREIKGSENLLVSVSDNLITLDTSVNFSDIYNEIDLKLDASGGTITGDLTIDGSLNVANTATFESDVYIKDNLTIDGSLFVRSVEAIDVSSAFILLNTGQAGTPPQWMQSGIVVDRGDEDPYVFIYDESSQAFRVGIAVADGSITYDDASTQAVATREDNPAIAGIAVWNSTVSRFDTSLGLTFDASGLYVDGSVKIQSLAGSGIRYVTVNADGTLDSQVLESFVKESSIGETLKWDASGLLQVDTSATGTGTYDTTLSPALAMPATVGGIPAGTTVSELVGDKLIKMWDELLFPTVNPTYVLPNNSFSSDSTSLVIAGSVPTIEFTAGFSKGSINITGNFQDFRSGNPNTYTYTDPSGNTLLTNVSTDSLSNIQTVAGYLVNVGYQSFTNTVSYDEGPQPFDNKGNPVDSSLAASTTSTKTVTLEGVYPLFSTTVDLTTYTQQPTVSMKTANNIQFNLVAQPGTIDKASFSIADAWTGAPTNRPITGIQTFDTVSNTWKYEGGTAATSLAKWTVSNTTRSIAGNIISYDNYEYNGVARSAISIRLNF